MEEKSPEIKTTDITITIKDDIGGFGFALAQMIGGKLLIQGEDRIDRKNYDTLYAALSEVNKKAIDSYIKYLKDNPKFVEAARVKAKAEDEAKMKKWAEQNNKNKGMVN